MLRTTLTSLLALTMAAGAALAEGDALIVGNADYTVLDRLRGAERVVSAAEPLEEAGLRVVSVAEADAEAVRKALVQFVDGIDAETDRVAVILSGRFAHNAGDVYLMPVGLKTPLSEATVMTGSLPLSVVLAVLADYPGRAVLMLAEGESGPLGARFLEAGAGAIDLPQGVSLIRGKPDLVAELARTELVKKDGRLIEAAREAGLAVEGFAPRDFAFLGAASATPPFQRPGPEPRMAPEPEPEEMAPQIAARQRGETGSTAAPRRDPEEERLWTQILDRDQIAGYEAYLADYPDGRHAAEARQRIAEIRRAAPPDPETAEADLNLRRDARRDIQRDLSLLDYNTRGIDGVFGRGTRSAIRQWQEANGQPATGYLTRAQIDRLDAQAARRQTELEAEAQERRTAQERRDRIYWEETGAAGDRAGLRAYLEQFPDGVYAEEAQDRLDDIEADRREAAEAREREAWQAARDTGTIAGFRSYLESYPDGAYAAEAEREIAVRQQTAQGGQGASRAEAEEAALNLPPPARRIAEDRLQSLGLKPGKIDGVFDDSTRRAIRRYQDARALNVTGYLDQATVVRLLADSLLGSLR
ncbi:peptidoglycan-binding protein [Roseivivax sp. CAU 1761]